MEAEQLGGLERELEGDPEDVGSLESAKEFACGIRRGVHRDLPPTLHCIRPFSAQPGQAGTGEHHPVHLEGQVLALL